LIDLTAKEISNLAEQCDCGADYSTCLSEHKGDCEYVVSEYRQRKRV